MIPRALVTRERSRQRVRASGSAGWDPTFPTIYIPVYKVPLGYEFEARRVFIDVGNSTDANLINVAMGQSQGVPRSYWQYRRSGQFISWGLNRVAPLSLPSWPGVETWGREEGPRLSGGEVFEFVGRIGNSPGAIQGTTTTVTLEGILTEVGSSK